MVTAVPDCPMLQVYRREFCNNVVEALSLKIRTMREQKIARWVRAPMAPDR